MTRKKSNVKALALAVTCAILAGGYSGLNPVYAETPVKITPAGTISGDTTSGYTFTGTEITITGSTIAGALDKIDISGAYAKDTTTLGDLNDNVAANQAAIVVLNGKTKDIIYEADGSTTVDGVNFNGGAVTGVTSINNTQVGGVTLSGGTIEAASGKFKVYDNGAIDAAGGAFRVGSSGTINALGIQTHSNGSVTLNDKLFLNAADASLQDKATGEAVSVSAMAKTNLNTKNIRVAKDTKVTSSDATYIDGITHAGGVRFADKKVRAKELVLEEEFADGTSAEARLTREGIVTLNGLSNGSSVIKAGNGSEVGGVKFDNKSITDVDSVMVNKDANNQVQINSEGIVVGLHSTVIGSDGVYAGGHTEATAKAVLGADGSIKGAGDGTGKYNFTVDSSNGTVTINDAGNVATISGGGISIADASGSDYLTMGKGTVLASASVISPKFFVDPNNAFEKNSLKVGDGTKGVTIADGEITTTGDATVGGNLSVAGTSTFTGKTTFSGGINTDTIDEATADKGVTVDGVLLKDKGIDAADGKFTVDGVTGDTTVGGKLDVTGDTTLKGKLGVTGDISTDGSVTAKGGLSAADGKFSVDGTNGDTTVKGNLSVAKNIKGQSLNIGTTGNEFTVDTLGNVNANGITTSDTTTNKIGGVTLSGSDINAKNLTLTGTLTAAKYNATDIEATNSIKVGATTMTDGKLDLGSNGTVDFGANELTDVQVGNINSVIQPGGIVKAADGSVIGGVSFSAKDITGVKDLTATGKVTAATITDGTASLSGGALTGLASVNIGGNTTIDNTGIKTNKLIVGSGLNATTIDEANGVVSAKGKIGAVKFTGAGKLENVTSIDGVSVAQNSGSAAGGLTFGGNAIIGATGIPFQSTGFKVDDDGDVEGKTFTTAADGTGNRSTLASGQLTIDPKNTWTKDNGIIASNVKVGTNELKDDGLHVGTNTLVKDGEITVGAGNSWSMANGIAATKAAINGVTIGETAGKAVFNNAGKATTIDGDTIQTGKITADELLIDKISLGKGGSSNITIDKDGHVQTKGDIKITDAAGNVMSKLSQDQAIFGNAADNQTTINNGKLNAKAKDTANQQAEFNFDENGLTVSGQNAAGQKSSFGFDTSTGIGTFTGQDNTTTAINGSNLTLTNGANSTALTAGGATFTGAAGEKGGKVTTINGGTITTDTLNVERINLGGEVIDKGAAGVEANSKLYMDAQGNFRAAGGNFKVNGADGAMTNTVGNTTFTTDTTGASMNYAGTANSNISVADGKAEMAVGTNAAVTATDGKVEIKGGTQNVTTTDAGTVFENSAHNTPFVTGGAANTVINGNEITTGKLTTDQLVITGSGAAGGAGSIAFGGDGSITSNIKDAATGKEATFKTNADGTFTEAKDGANVTTNTVNAQGNTNKVTDGTNTSTATQTATSIGGVVTNGTVTMKQELTADGLKLEQTGYDEVNIAKGDVTVKNNRNTANPNQEVHLSDLGSLNNLDSELTARDEYKDNKTAIGAINAEAGIRREEVARLDNRIDDVNNRVDKVGAMAAAIASLKSIGYDPQAPSEFSIGLGQYKGETGVAMGFFHYPNKNFMINVSLSTAGGETMGGIGATWRFGHKSPQKLLDEQREAQAKKELAAAEKYQAAAKLAKEAQERAEYAAKLARQAQVSADNAKAAADATQAKHFQ